MKHQYNEKLEELESKNGSLISIGILIIFLKYYCGK